MAVDPAGVRGTVVSGPSWVTAPITAPEPEMPAAPKLGQQNIERESTAAVSGYDRR